MLTRIALPALAAAAALIATAPLTHDSAQARPVMAPPPSGANPQFERLRAENVRLRAELGQLRSVVDDGLDRIDGLARASRDRRLSFRIHRAIEDLRAQAGGGDDGWDQAGGWDQPGGWDQGGPWQPQPQPGYGAMSATDFARLQAQITAATFPADQMNVIGAAVSRNRFTVDQVVALMRMMAFDDARIEIAVLLAPRVVDGNRFYLTLDALQFSSSKDTLRQRVQF